MKTREEVVAFCNTLPFVYEDAPFHDDNWTLMRHKENKKTFAFIFEKDGLVWINVKAGLLGCELWRMTYSAVVPAYHMNKQHWISIILDGTMDDGDIRRLIEDSFDLTKKKNGRGA